MNSEIPIEENALVRCDTPVIFYGPDWDDKQEGLTLQKSTCQLARHPKDFRLYLMVHCASPCSPADDGLCIYIDIPSLVDWLLGMMTVRGLFIEMQSFFSNAKSKWGNTLGNSNE